MSEHRLLVVSDDFIDRLDAIRDGKSREQFLELCVLLIGELDSMRGDKARLEFVLGVREQIENQERRIRDLERVTIEFLQSLEGRSGLSLSPAYATPTLSVATSLAPPPAQPPPVAIAVAPPVQAIQHTAVAVMAPPQPVVQPIVEPVPLPVPVLQPVQQPMLQPVQQPMLQPVQQPMLQPMVQSVVTPIIAAVPATPAPLAAVPVAAAVQPAAAPAAQQETEDSARRDQIWHRETRERETLRDVAAEDDEHTEIITRQKKNAVELGSETPEEAYNRAIFNILWLVGAVLYGFGDTVTSYIVFKVGGVEANPFMAFFLKLGGIPPFVAAKTLIMAGLFALSVFVFSPLKRSGWVIPLITAIGGGYLVVHNLLVLFNR